MSDGAGRRKSGTGRARARRRSTQRGGKRFAAATAGGTSSAPAEELHEPALRSRPPRFAAPQRVAALSREAEYAYIRADMRRLLVIAGSLFALMLVILVVVGQ